MNNGTSPLVEPEAEGWNTALSYVGVVNLVGLWFAYQVLVVLYNLSPFHPLYKFPGPRLASATYLYEAYFDLWLFGRYTRRIRQMHEKYGPIVRINPGELHCSDPFFIDEVYAASGRVRDKWQHQLNGHGTGPISVAGFGTREHELHRMRRGAVSKFFSRQQILKLENDIQELARYTMDKLLSSVAGKGPFEIKEAFHCYTADIISKTVFGESMGFVAQDDWEPNFTTWTRSATMTTFKFRFITPVRAVLSMIPESVIPVIANFAGGDLAEMMNYLNVIIPKMIKNALGNSELENMFTEILESKSLPESEKSMTRLSGEGFVFLAAGTETTAAVLTTITYFLLAQPEVHKRLLEELKDVDTNNMKWVDLEHRLYLRGIIHEALRIMPAFAGRSARVAREEALVYKSEDGKVEWVIPKNTPVGLSSMISHWNTDLFPNPDDFVPERWQVDGQPNHKLEGILLSFSKGSRACLGKNLAHCELYIMTVLLAFRIIPRARLYGTTIENIAYDHDAIVPHSKKGALSVRVEID